MALISPLSPFQLFPLPSQGPGAPSPAAVTSPPAPTAAAAAAFLLPLLQDHQNGKAASVLTMEIESVGFSSETSAALARRIFQLSTYQPNARPRFFTILKKTNFAEILKIAHTTNPVLADFVVDYWARTGTCFDLRGRFNPTKDTGKAFHRLNQLLVYLNQQFSNQLTPPDNAKRSQERIFKQTYPTYPANLVGNNLLPVPLSSSRIESRRPIPLASAPATEAEVLEAFKEELRGINKNFKTTKEKITAGYRAARRETGLFDGTLKIKAALFKKMVRWIGRICKEAFLFKRFDRSDGSIVFIGAAPSRQKSPPVLVMRMNPQGVFEMWTGFQNSGVIITNTAPVTCSVDYNQLRQVWPEPPLAVSGNEGSLPPQPYTP